MTSSGPDTSIVILGASCRAAAQCAVRAGFQPHAYDLFVDRDLIDCSKTGQLDALQGSEELWRNPHWNGTPMLLAGGMEHRPELVDRLRSHGLRCGVTGWMLKELRDFENWRSWAFCAGIGFPETRFSRPPEANHSSLPAESQNAQWLRKRRKGAGGIGIVVESFSSTTESDEEPQHYWQRRLDGISIGVSFLSDAVRNHTLGSALSLTQEDVWGPEPYSYRGSISPIALPLVFAQQLDRFGDLVRRDVGHRGLWQADFIVSKDHLSLLEINPRWSSSMELLDALGRIAIPGRGVNEPKSSLVEWHVQSLGESPISIHRDEGESDPQKTSCTIGKCIFYAQRDQRIDEQLLESWWRNRWHGSLQELDAGVRYADIPPAPSTMERGYPIVSCFASGNSCESIVNQFREAESNIFTPH